MDELTAAYNAAYDAALESVQGQYNLWDQAADVVATSAGSMNRALESQITYWQDYNANLAALGSRTSDIEGLSDIIASFADGSKDSVNAIAGMSKASDDDLKAMVSSWQKLQEEQKTVSDSLADLETNYTTSMNALQEELEDLQKELEAAIAEMDLGSEAAESGKNTVQGFISGSEEMLPAVESAYRRIAKAAINAIDMQMDSHSPSRVMFERGEWAMAGFTGGVESMQPEVAAVMAETANAGTNAFAAEEAQMITLAPQLMAALSAINTGTNVVAAENYSGGAGINITIAPEYQITGLEAPPQLEAILSANNEDLRELILDILENEGIDAARRAYR